MSRTLPELPAPLVMERSYGHGQFDWYDTPTHFTASQMREYGEACIEDAQRWLPIVEAPVGVEMFVAIAKNVPMGSAGDYTTDPYVVWQRPKGVFERWPHKFPPTHFLPLKTRP